MTPCCFTRNETDTTWVIPKSSEGQNNNFLQPYGSKIHLLWRHVASTTSSHSDSFSVVVVVVVRLSHHNIMKLKPFLSQQTYPQPPQKSSSTLS